MLSMKKILFMLFALAIPVLLLAAEPVREWKSKSGKTIVEAKFDVAGDSDPETVYLLKDGKRFKVSAPVQTTSLGTPGAKAGEKRIITVNGVEFPFCWCPAGKFMMGSPMSKKDRYSSETLHEVTLTKGFWMMETEVTVGMFKAFVSDTGYEPKGDDRLGWTGVSWEPNSKCSWLNPGFSQTDNHPVTCVSWDDAVAFCKWLSRKIGENITLPTEAQWEYACRAGSTGEYAGDLDAMAWYGFNATPKGTSTEATTHPVGTKKANDWGLYDMHGNVWEWCADWDGFYPSESVTDPTGSSSGSDRVHRGGSWYLNALCCRSAVRGSSAPRSRGILLGFRVIRGQ